MKRRNNKKYFISVLITAALIAAVLAGCNNSGSKASSSEQEIVSSESSAPQAESSSSQSSSEEDSSSEAPSEQAVSKNVDKEAVSNAYFDDAVFIGDSRTEGFMMYSGITNAKSLAYKGLTADDVFTENVINLNGNMTTVINALENMSFSKVYIMLGINELGWAYSDIFIEKYGEIIDAVKGINPSSEIYVQSILPVSKKVSQTHDYITNQKINEYNSLIKNMAEQKNVNYLNVAEIFKDSTGSLPEDAAPDGIHLKKAYCEQWLEYLKKHTA